MPDSVHSAYHLKARVAFVFPRKPSPNWNPLETDECYQTMQSMLEYQSSFSSPAIFCNVLRDFQLRASKPEAARQRNWDRVPFQAGGLFRKAGSSSDPKRAKQLKRQAETILAEERIKRDALKASKDIKHGRSLSRKSKLFNRPCIPLGLVISL